ncbi:uncharacterized protein VTP21DRAFT_5173 [Calcarisporiella thermophila]|uniref:uncharacterized protein n=1 Tax=Calcarisporiella thermophila TaxID=911321 RepID=UPI003743E586
MSEHTFFKDYSPCSLFSPPTPPLTPMRMEYDSKSHGETPNILSATFTMPRASTSKAYTYRRGHWQGRASELVEALHMLERQVQTTHSPSSIAKRRQRKSPPVRLPTPPSLIYASGFFKLEAVSPTLSHRSPKLSSLISKQGLTLGHASLTSLPSKPSQRLSSSPTRTTSEIPQENMVSIKEIEPIINEDKLSRAVQRLQWKGSQLDISHLPDQSLLHPLEKRICSTLRLTPSQYLSCKSALLRGSKEHQKQGKAFRKTDAQKLCRVDVNKTSKIWEVFDRAGWFD